MNDKQCVRCGSDNNIEIDHIQDKQYMGSEAPNNKRPLCQPCHKYRHAKDKIIMAIAACVRRNDSDKRTIVMWMWRLAVLEMSNDPFLIRKRGTFQSYWEDKSTHKKEQMTKLFGVDK